MALAHACCAVSWWGTVGKSGALVLTGGADVVIVTCVE